MYALKVADGIRHCCGVSEIYGITNIDRETFVPKEVALACCAVYMFKNKKGVFLFEDVDKADVVPERAGTRVKALATFITDNGLGTAVLCPPVRNPNTSNWLTLLNWLVSFNGLTKFWEENEPKASLKNWNFVTETFGRGIPDVQPREEHVVYRNTAPAITTAQRFF